MCMCICANVDIDVHVHVDRHVHDSSSSSSACQPPCLELALAARMNMRVPNAEARLKDAGMLGRRGPKDHKNTRIPRTMVS